MAVEFTYHGHLKEVQEDPALVAIWAGQTAPFDRLEWFAGMVEDCGMEPLLAVAREGEEVALLPLARRHGYLSELGNFYTFRFRPILSANGVALLPALARDLRRNFGRIRLPSLPVEDGTAGLVASAFRDGGWLALKGEELPNHVLEIAGRSYAAYLTARPGKLRTTLTRKASKLEVELFDQFDPATWKAYQKIYANSWKPDEFSLDFLRNFAEREGGAGRLRMGIVRAKGMPVAAQLWTVEAAIAYIHKLAHTRDSTAFSPGTVLTAAMFERVIDHDNVTLIDFGTGDDSYKRDWMESVRHRVSYEFIDPVRPRNWPVIAKHVASRGLHRLALTRSAG